MELKGYATSKAYWLKFFWGVLIGLLVALSVLFYNYVMNLGLTWLWPEPPGWEPFSGSWRVVLIMTIAGFIVGLLHRFMKAREIGVAEIIKDGRTDNKFVPGGLLVSLVSLIGGFSIGPEVPSGMLAGGIATWISEKRADKEDAQRSNVISSITSAYGGLFTAPLGAIMMVLEMPHMQSANFYGTLIIAAAASMVGFAVFYLSGSDQFAGLLRILDLPVYDLRVWHMLIAVVLGIVGAVLALTFGLTMGLLKRLIKPIDVNPILRNTLVGFLLGLLGYALPLTLFLGSDGLEVVTDNAVEMGAALLVVYVFAKIFATAGAISASFIGGPIFPLFFVGGAMGTVINLLFPEIPIALAVGCGMAAVTAGALPIPITMGIYTILIVGLPLTEAIPILIAAFTAFLIIRGFGLVAKTVKPKETVEKEGETTQNIPADNEHK